MHTRCSSIQQHHILAQMGWAGQVIRVKHKQLPKRLFYGEPNSGERPQHNSRKMYRKCVKESLMKLDMNKSDWEIYALERNKWGGAVRTGCNASEGNIIQCTEHKRACRKRTIGSEINSEYFRYVMSDRFLLSKAVSVNHMYLHEIRNAQEGNNLELQLPLTIYGTKLVRQVHKTFFQNQIPKRKDVE
uniref:Uncharacterized protein n=1 Tax=Octopus bimaculoides TaxID=37653 RepID=A0A0L8GNR7_OCTBM